VYLPEHEWHEISLLFYQFLLREKGVRTSYLGQSLPYDALQECIEKLKPKAILSSWLTAVDSKFVVNYFKRLRKDYPDLKVFAGGAQVKSNAEVLSSYITVVKDIDEVIKYL
jgi:methanogenic corrinoid protein MtbC1